MLSMRWTTAIIVLAVVAPILGLFANRNIEASILLAGVAAILGILTVTVLLLAEIGDAVQTIARDRNPKYYPDRGEQYDDGIALQPRAHHVRMIIAAIECVNRSKTRSAPVATQNPASDPRELPNAHSLGNYINIVIPSDR